jgi:hypothetical protein
MPGEERLKMIFQVAMMERTLFSIPLPANGSIYYNHDLDPGIKTIDLPGGGENGRFCIGPDAHYTWWYKERVSLPIEREPCE